MPIRSNPDLSRCKTLVVATWDVARGTLRGHRYPCIRGRGWVRATLSPLGRRFQTGDDPRRCAPCRPSFWRQSVSFRRRPATVLEWVGPQLPRETVGRRCARGRVAKPKAPSAVVGIIQAYVYPAMSKTISEQGGQIIRTH